MAGMARVASSTARLWRTRVTSMRLFMSEAEEEKGNGEQLVEDEGDVKCVVHCSTCSGMGCLAEHRAPLLTA
jgi:hypothetical protein